MGGGGTVKVPKEGMKLRVVRGIGGSCRLPKSGWLQLVSVYCVS